MKTRTLKIFHYSHKFMGFPNLFRKPTKKEKKTTQIKNNASQGKSGEQQVVARWRMTSFDKYSDSAKKGWQVDLK